MNQILLKFIYLLFIVCCASFQLKPTIHNRQIKIQMIDNDISKPKKLLFNSIQVPDYLDGSLAGDLGFDPLHIAKNKENLFILREAESKHCRLAMLASVGWPVSG